jgi:hypothetical protein
MEQTIQMARLLRKMQEYAPKYALQLNPTLNMQKAINISTCYLQVAGTAVFKQHFTNSCSRYENEYAGTFGKFQLERMKVVGEHFLTSGDYRVSGSLTQRVPNYQHSQY